MHSPPENVAELFVQLSEVTRHGGREVMARQMRLCDTKYLGPGAAEEEVDLSRWHKVAQCLFQFST